MSNRRRIKVRVFYDRRQREWDVWRGGDFVHYYPTKAAAVERAREIARSLPLSQLVIWKKNGRIQTEHTYGADPRRHRG